MPRPSRAINYHKKNHFHSAEDQAIRAKLEQAQDEAECDAIIARGRAEVQETWSDKERESRAGKRRGDETVEIRGVSDKWVVYQCRTIV